MGRAGAMRGLVPKPDAAQAAGLVAALLLALPAAAQTAPPAADAAPAADGAPAVGGERSTAPATTPALESPALGPLAGREGPLVMPPLESGILSGFATTAPGVGVTGIRMPFELGNRPYAIRPSIGIELLGTDNLFQSNTNQRSDLVTTIAPSLEGAISTTRLSGSLRYTPALRLYAANSNQDGVEQVGDGRLLAALVPGRFYLDMRGAASVVPSVPGQIPGSGQVLPQPDIMQTFTAQVTPFLVQRFGSTASLQGGYSFQYSAQNGSGFSQSNQNNLNDNYTAHSGFAVLRSGEDFGRLALQARFTDTRYVGSGIYDGAHRLLTALETRYAILRNVAVLGEIGYENQEYAGSNPFSISDAVWSAGLRLTPGPNSIVIVRYGRLNGFNSLNVNAGVALGVRTSLFGVYRETLATSLTNAQDLLTTTTTDALGNPVDGQSGAPVVLINPFLGLSDTLYRMRIGTMSLRHQWPRDSFTLSGTWQDQTPVTSGGNAFVNANQGTYATFTWGHEFSPRTTGFATVQYGRASTWPPYQTDDIYSAAATLAHELSDKLTASLQFAWIRDAAAEPTQAYTQSVLRARLRRSF